MKIFHTILLASLMSLFFGCGQNGERRPAQVRWGQFLLGGKAAHISLSRKGTELYSADLDYATLTEYRKYPSGTYSVSIKSGGREILNKKVGLGTGGTYTLSIYGIPLKNQSSNQRSTAMKLHRIVEGAAATTPNAYLPQLDIMDDYFASAKDKAKIRVVHLAPGVVPIKATVSVSGKGQVGFSAVSYPTITKNKSIATGAADVELGLDSSDQMVDHEKLNIKAEQLYTLFVIPDKKKYLNHLRAVVGTTRKTH